MNNNNNNNKHWDTRYLATKAFNDGIATAFLGIALAVGIIFGVLMISIIILSTSCLKLFILRIFLLGIDALMLKLGFNEYIKIQYPYVELEALCNNSLFYNKDDGLCNIHDKIDDTSIVIEEK